MKKKPFVKGDWKYNNKREQLKSLIHKKDIYAIRNYKKIKHIAANPVQSFLTNDEFLKHIKLPEKLSKKENHNTYSETSNQKISINQNDDRKLYIKSLNEKVKNLMTPPHLESKNYKDINNSKMHIKDRFKKCYEIYEQSKQQKLDELNKKEEMKKIKECSLKKRKQNSRLWAQRTKKGQLKMNTIISLYTDKIIAKNYTE